MTEKEERKRVCVCEREQERHLDGYSFLFLHLSGRLNSTGFVTMNLSESFRKGCWLGNGREITWKKQEEENGTMTEKIGFFLTKDTVWKDKSM